MEIPESYHGEEMVGTGENLDIPSSYNGKKVYLVFDGIMSNPGIFINGKIAGKWDYGYNSFYIDITEHLQYNDAMTYLLFMLITETMTADGTPEQVFTEKSR
ncbi:MAG: hypothetical protein MZV63_15335 [Marinilabiliales bacterium]|nr:hypothetical protein [Marinilabiliales bacterium]